MSELALGQGVLETYVYLCPIPIGVGAQLIGGGGDCKDLPD